MISNVFQFNQGMELWLKQCDTLTTQGFRDIVRQLFWRLTLKTPQFSGKAVANWRINVGSPDLDWDDALGDDIAWDGEAHEQGDRRWVDYARRRAKPVIDSIRYRDKVYITNSVMGDAGPGTGKYDLAYLEALQVPGMWRNKLRAANQPFESAEDSLIIVSTQFGSAGFDLPRVGGATLG